MHLTKRGGVWHFHRRVPAEYAHVDTREIVFQSTRVKVSADRAGIRAGAVAERLNAELETFWRGLIGEQATAARVAYDLARRKARSAGFVYTPLPDLVNGPIAELLDRTEFLAGNKRADNPEIVTAIMGTVSAPPVLLSALFETYKRLTATAFTDFSEDQARRWTHAKQRAISNLIGVIGDVAINSITRAQAVTFRQWWSDRVLDERVLPGTANKDFGHINNMISTVNELLALGMATHPFEKLRLEGDPENSRPPFETEFLRTRILGAGVLDGLNSEARGILHVMVETGLRPVEICALTKNTIRLDTDVPHLQVRAENRRTKTQHSLRDIPLVGVSLAAIKRNPEGFPRYLDNSATLSAVINNYFADNDLRPTEKHSLYSVRHAFKDRMRAVEAPEEMIDELMGHKIDKPKYGSGYGLAQKRKWIEKIAFTLQAAA